MDLSVEMQQLVDSEIAIAEKVKLAVRDAAIRQRTTRSQAYAKRVMDLREQATTANASDLPALFDYLHSDQQLAARAQTPQTLPDLRAPYFGHLQITEENGPTRELLIGHDTLIDNDHDVCLVDWQTAPLAKLFFLYREGDDFELNLPHKTLRGKIKARRILNFRMGQLVSIRLKDQDLRLTSDAKWSVFAHDDSSQLSGGEGSAVRGFGLNIAKDAANEITGLLDEQQYRILQQSDEQPVLILGSAGSGKTTVAIHRLAHLAKRDPQRFAAHRLLMLVPEEGLVRLSRKLLASLRLDRVVVETYDQWLYQQLSHVLPELRKKLCNATPARIIRLKRHPALFKALDKLKPRKLAQIQELVASQFSAPLRDKLSQGFPALNSESLIKVVDHICNTARKLVSPELGRQVEQQCERFRNQCRTILVDVRSDLLFLFRNESLLNDIISDAKGELDKHMINELYRHTLLQLTAPEGPTTKDLDPDRARTVDDLDLEDESLQDDEELYRTIDIEDFTLMAHLLKQYFGGLGTLERSFHRYQHIVIDEAQELAESELGLIAQVLEPDANLTIAGDALQQNDSSAIFRGWKQTMKALGAEAYETNQLETSYRCPRTIMEFAWKVLGSQAPTTKPHCPREGSPVLTSTAGSDGHALSLIAESLDVLLSNEPKASVAIITAEPDTAKEFYRGLRDIVDVRWIRNGEFDFQPGVDLSDVSQVKGLEFDYVIIPDLDIYRYPDTTEHRRLLHLAATRAIHQLWVICGKSPSLIVRDWIQL